MTVSAVLVIELSMAYYNFQETINQVNLIHGYSGFYRSLQKLDFIKVKKVLVTDQLMTTLPEVSLTQVVQPLGSRC